MPEQESFKYADRPFALITGASSGIGRALVNEFVAHGYNAILSARSAEKMHTHAADLERRFGITALVIPADLESPTGAANLYADIKRRHISLSALVNNAGYGTFGLFQDMSLESQLAMMQLNMTSLVALTKLFLPDLVATNGKILNIASTAAFQPGPYMAVYYATKAFVLSFSEALAAELALPPSGTVQILRSLWTKAGLSPTARARDDSRSSGSRLSTLRSRPRVTITALCPGPTASGFQDKAAMRHSKMVRGKRLPTSEEVARKGFRALQRGKRVYIPGWKNWLLAQLPRLSPRRLVTAVVIWVTGPAE
ncbi:MAG TPA: SDR family oxidoreductase [Lacipirellulaceae bacterium]|nr:SDR family oxidoreductase [Lacipirellulaceae bacterium]